MMQRLVRPFVALLAVFALAFVLTDQPRDGLLQPPAPGDVAWRIHVADHGFHTGFVIGREDLASLAQAEEMPALIAVADRFRDYRFLEIGWGDEGFYRGDIGLDWKSAQTTIRALLSPGNASVLHLVGLNRAPDDVFVNSHIVALDVSAQGAKNLAAFIDATFARNVDGQVVELGPGIYGPSLFYRAVPAYNILFTCNHWVASGLHKAGFGVSMFAATLSAGLRADMAWRVWARW